MGNSAVQRKGDGVDFVLWQMEEEKKRNEPEQISDYPETVQTMLRAFASVWKLPAGAIPTKRQKSKYEQWVSELGQLNEVCGSHQEEALQIALDRYESLKSKFIVYHPLAIRSLLIHAVGEMNRNKSKEIKNTVQEIEQPKKEEGVIVSSDKFRSLRQNFSTQE